jgi:hypothetical protein
MFRYILELREVKNKLESEGYQEYIQRVKG